MVTGHIHKAYILEKNDEKSLLSHEYPVVVGSACYGDNDFWGAGLVLNKNTLQVYFTDANQQVKEEYTIDLTSGKIKA